MNTRDSEANEEAPSKKVTPPVIDLTWGGARPTASTTIPHPDPEDEDEEDASNEEEQTEQS